MEQQQQQVWYGISEQMREAVVNYLRTKPMDEVEGLVAMMRQLPKANNSAQQEPAPEE